MSKYKMEDGTVVDTDRRRAVYYEETDFDGKNRISRATGSQWDHQTLYKSAKGRWYLVHDSQWQGSRPHAEFITDEEACRWLLLMEKELPKTLKALEGGVCE